VLTSKMIESYDTDQLLDEEMPNLKDLIGNNNLIDSVIINSDSDYGNTSNDDVHNKSNNSINNDRKLKDKTDTIGMLKSRILQSYDQEVRNKQQASHNECKPTTININIKDKRDEQM